MTLIAIISVKSKLDHSSNNPVKAIRANSPRNLEDGLLYFFKKESNHKFNSMNKSNIQDYEIIDDYYQTELDVSHWYYSFLDKLDLQENYEFVENIVHLPESHIQIYDLEKTYTIKLLVCPENSIFSTCNKFLVEHQSDTKDLSLTPHHEFTDSGHTAIPEQDIIDVLDTPVYLYEDPNITIRINDHVHLKDIERLTEFRYNNLDISNAIMDIEKEEWTIGYGGGHSGPSYIRKGTREVEVINNFLKKVKADTIILPDDISKRHINTIIKNPDIKRIIVSENCKFFSMHEGMLYNKKKTKLVMKPR